VLWARGDRGGKLRVRLFGGPHRRIEPVRVQEAFRYTPFPEHPDFAVHEIATGPLNAGIFPNRNVDPTLNPEVLFFHGPTSPADVTSWDQAKRWFNFGTLEIGAGGDLTAEVVDTAGESQFSLTLEPR
jgi:alkaline phosphatase D